MEEKLSGQWRPDLSAMRQQPQPDVNFDILERWLLIGGREAFLYHVTGFVSDLNVQRIIQFFLERTPEEISETPEGFLARDTAFGSVKLETAVDKLVTSVLSGLRVLLVEGYAVGLTFDIRNYPSRGVQEPDKDRVLRGSRDGFSETIIANTALIRRRIRDLRLLLMQNTH